MNGQNPAKALREQFGLNGGPVQAVQCYRKGMDFDHPDVQTASWILITPDGRRVHVNTYDGRAGRNFSQADFTYDLPTGDKKKMKKIFKGYTEVTDPADWCPISTKVDGTGAVIETPEAPVEEAILEGADFEPEGDDAGSGSESEE